MPEITGPDGTPDTKPASAALVCLHVWETAAAHRARCRICGFVVSIITEEV